jgi:hypothetical protein
MLHVAQGELPNTRGKVTAGLGGAGSQRFIADHYEASPGPVSALPPLPPEFLLSGPVIIKGKEVFDA